VAANAGPTPAEQTYAVEVQPGAAWAPLPNGYRRRDPEATVLHQAVRENLATFLAEAGEHGGLPRHVEQELFDYLDCGVLSRGFSRVQCQSCGDELLVAFSWWPSRASGAGCAPRAAPGERTTPPSTWWSACCPTCHTASGRCPSPGASAGTWPGISVSPRRCSTSSCAPSSASSGAAATSLASRGKALVLPQRRRGDELGFEGQGTGAAASFVQLFGSALQANTHFHVLVPEGLFAAPSPETQARATFLPLPPPEDEEVESLLCTVARRVVRLLKRLGRLDEDAYPQDALQVLQVASIQRRLPFPPGDEAPPRKRRCASLEGFSLHANTHTHANDRENLERLCRYGARGPLSLERLSRREDGRLAYKLKRPAPDGSTHLLVTPLAALVPPPRVNLTRFHGVLAPNAKLRPLVVPPPPPPPPCSHLSPPPPPPLPPPASLPPSSRHRRIPWAQLLRRSFGEDVLSCSRCGGRRRVLAYITDPSVVRTILVHLHLPSTARPISPARDPPQARFALLSA